jgi:hypothetical protein
LVLKAVSAFQNDEKQIKEGDKMSKFRLTKNLGMVLLGIWLIMTGLIPLLHLNFEGLPLIMTILAIASGVFILLGR